MCKFILIIVPFLFLSCAVSYRNISTTGYEYKSLPDLRTDLKISKADNSIFKDSGNKRMENKANRHGLKLIPLLIENNTNDTVYFNNKTIEFFINYEVAEIIPPSKYIRTIKQKAWSHSIEIIIGSITFLAPNSNGFSINPIKPFNLFIPYGIYNIVKAVKANKKMKSEFEKLDLLDKTIYPHQKYYGIVCVKSATTENIFIRLKK